MHDPFLLTAKLLLPVATLLAIAGIGGGIWLVVDCLRAQRLANQLDKQIAKLPCHVCGLPVSECRTHLKNDPDQQTLHAREWRRHFAEHCQLNSTFPQQ